MKNTLWLIIILVIVVLGIGYFTFQKPSTLQTTEPQTTQQSNDQEPIQSQPLALVGDNAINIANQQAGNEIQVDFAIIEDGGYVVIHEDNVGKPGTIVGNSDYLAPGRSDGVSISLKKASQDGETLYAMLHNDDGNERFQAASDLPIRDEQGNVIVMPFKIGDQEVEATSSLNQVSLTSGNFFFRPNSFEINRGEVNVDIEQNSGFHTFVIDELGVKETLQTGKSFTFTAGQGTYEYYCNVPGHREQGMFGSLIVN